MEPSSVYQKLRFAEQRLADVRRLVATNRFVPEFDARQQTIQEFFFHLVGAIHYLSQLANERRKLGLHREFVWPRDVADQLEGLSPSDPLVPALRALCVSMKLKDRPNDLYSGNGLLYRVFNYRNEVAHRNINPFQFALSATSPLAYLDLDPRDSSARASKLTVDVDLQAMFDLVQQRCEDALGAI